MPNSQKNTSPNSELVKTSQKETTPVNRAQHLWIGMLALTIGGVIGWLRLGQGWFPHDEGQLGLSSLNVCNGLLPHRDFDEMYTGALSFLNALSFKIWGVSSSSMRLMLFCWFIPFLGCVYAIAIRFVAPIGAALVTVLAAVWSIPIYPAAMPSWYNLFMAATATWLVLKFIESGAVRFLLFTGVAIGISICFKISGLFVLAAVLLLLLYRNQQTCSQSLSAKASSLPQSGGAANHADRSLLFSSLVSIALLGATALSLKFVSQADGLMQFVHFAIPFMALTLFVLRNEWIEARGSFRVRIQTTSIDCAILLLGVAIPILILVGYYFQQNALGDWIHGTFVLPTKRIDGAAFKFPGPNLFLISLLFGYAIFIFIPSIGKTKKSWVPIWTTIALALLVTFLSYTKAGFNLGFHSFRNFGPILIVGNLLLLIFRDSEMTMLQRQRTFAVTVVAFFVSLIQFPFASPLYFFYAASMLLLATCAVAQIQNETGKKILFAIGCFFVVLSCVRFHSATPANCLTSLYVPQPLKKMTNPRCDLTIGANEADVYKQVVELVTTKSKPGDTILALPDSPQIAFLADRKPFNGVMYEFFHPGLYSETEKVRKQLAEQNIDLVVVNESPPFSDSISDKFRIMLHSDFSVIGTVETKLGANKITAFTVFCRKRE